MRRVRIAPGAIIALTGLAMLACSLTGSGAATVTPVPPPSATPTVVVPATAAATALSTATIEPPTAAATATITPTSTIILVVVGQDKKIGLVAFDGRNLPLSQAPGILYALATLSTDPAALNHAYAIGPQGVNELTFVNNSTDGFASFTGASAPQGEVAWDHYSSTANANGTLNSEIFIANSDGSNLHSALKLSADHILHVVRFSPDGQRLYYSQEPLGLGGYILFDGISDLWSLDVAAGTTQQLVPAAAAGTICLDDFTPDESLVALHCADKTISVLDTTTGNIGLITAPAVITDWAQHGSARISPDQTRVAYALARGNGDNEQGWVAMSDSLTGTSHLVATAPPNDYFSVKGWLNNTTLVLQSWRGSAPGVWVMQADGSDLRRIADGLFLGGG